MPYRSILLPRMGIRRFACGCAVSRRRGPKAGEFGRGPAARKAPSHSLFVTWPPAASTSSKDGYAAYGRSAGLRRHRGAFVQTQFRTESSALHSRCTQQPLGDGFRCVCGPFSGPIKSPTPSVVGLPRSNWAHDTIKCTSFLVLNLLQTTIHASCCRPQPLGMESSLPSRCASTMIGRPPADTPLPATLALLTLNEAFRAWAVSNAASSLSYQLSCSPKLDGGALCISRHCPCQSFSPAHPMPSASSVLRRQHRCA